MVYNNILRKYICSLKKRFLILFILFVYSSYGQSINQDVIGNGGGTYLQSSVSMQYNIGEPMIETYNEANKPQMYLGFEQGSYSIVGIEESRIVPNLELLLYPNPSNGQFYLQVDSEDLQNFKLAVNDQLGKLITQSNQLQEKTTLIDLRTFERGIYYVIVTNSKFDYQKTFKLIKQ
jgi:hypothetical protein